MGRLQDHLLDFPQNPKPFSAFGLVDNLYTPQDNMEPHMPSFKQRYRFHGLLWCSVSLVACLYFVVRGSVYTVGGSFIHTNPIEAEIVA